MVGEGVASLPVSTQGSPCGLQQVGSAPLSLPKGRGYACFGQDILPGHVQFDIRFYPQSMFVELILDEASEAYIETVSALSGGQGMWCEPLCPAQPCLGCEVPRAIQPVQHSEDSSPKQ